MPIYPIKCDVCDHKEDVFRSIANYDDLPNHCGVKMHRTVCAPMISVDYQPYLCMGTGEYVTGRKYRREMMKRRGLVEADTTIKQQREVTGDFNVRAELTEAVKQVIGA